MLTKPLFDIQFNQEALESLSAKLAQIFQSVAEIAAGVTLDIPGILGPDFVEEAETWCEQQLALRRDEAAKLTRAARTYGYRDAKVVWLQDPCQFAFIYLDGLVCADIPQIGDDYASALRWIRAEAGDWH
ncbi:MAG: hypothetical protein K8L91_08015 [Anaerolineae bacterium]|nr:hypothetical protein [Anaerolineae bacterium]